MERVFGRGFFALLLGLVMLAGCASDRVDWNAHVGNLTYDQALLQLGPPDKMAKLSDGTTVAEWLTHRGYSTYYPPLAYGYSPWSYGPYYGPAYVDTAPNYYIRLTFGPDGVLRDWKRFYK